MLLHHFDMVPRDKLWSRMEELRVPRHLRAAVHRMYEEVKVKIITSTGIFESLEVISRSSKVAHCLVPFLGYILTSLKSG